MTVRAVYEKLGGIYSALCNLGLRIKVLEDSSGGSVDEELRSAFGDDTTQTHATIRDISGATEVIYRVENGFAVYNPTSVLTDDGTESSAAIVDASGRKYVIMSAQDLFRFYINTWDPFQQI